MKVSEPPTPTPQGPACVHDGIGAHLAQRWEANPPPHPPTHPTHPHNHNRDLPDIYVVPAACALPCCSMTALQAPQHARNPPLVRCRSRNATPWRWKWGGGGWKKGQRDALMQNTQSMQ